MTLVSSPPPPSIRSLIKQPWFWVALLTILAFVVRLAWSFHQDYFPLGGDGRWYLAVAANIEHGRGFVIAWDAHGREITGPGDATAYWPPAYPFTLAAGFKVFGVGMRAAEVLNTACGAAVVPLTFLLGRRVFDARAGVLGAAVVAFMPEPVLSSQFIMSENLFTPIFLAALVVLAYAWPERPRFALPLVFGAITGLAVLTRGDGLALVPVAAFVWLIRVGLRNAALNTAIAVVAMVAVVTPWVVRNAVALDAFVPVATSTGINLRIGHSADSDGTFFYPERIKSADSENTLFESMQPDQEVSRSDTYARRAVVYAAHHPLDEARLSWRKVYWLFYVNGEHFRYSLTLGAFPIRPHWLFEAMPPLLSVSRYILLALATLSLPLWVRARDWKAVLLLSTVVFWVLIHVAVFSQSRYLLPLMPVLALSAACLVIWAWDRARLLVAPNRAVAPEPAPAG